MPRRHSRPMLRGRPHSAARRPGTTPAGPFLRLTSRPLVPRRARHSSMYFWPEEPPPSLWSYKAGLIGHCRARTAFNAPHTPHAGGAGGSVAFGSLGRGGSFLRSSHRARSHRRQGVEEPKPSGGAKDLPSGGALNAPPYPPTRRAGGPVGFASVVQNISLARGRREKIAGARSARQGQALRARRLRPGTTRRALAFAPLARKRQKAPRPLPAKKNGGRGARHGPSLGAAKTREG